MTSLAQIAQNKKHQARDAFIEAVWAEAPLEHLADLARVLEGLSEVHREAIVLRFIDGMSLEEMAAALDVPEGTIKSRLHNAIAALRADPRTARYFNQDR